MVMADIVDDAGRHQASAHAGGGVPIDSDPTPARWTAPACSAARLVRR
jgi:hypothetical protein